MWLLDQLAEQHINQAIEQGEFANLPGQGHPLSLDDADLIPEEQRAAFRLMKNSGLIPAEITLRQEISNIDSLITKAVNQDVRKSLDKKRNALVLQLNIKHPQSSLLSERYYFEKYAEKDD